MNLFVRSPILHIIIVSTPAKLPGPVTLINISPYTYTGTVLIAITTSLPIKAIGAGMNFLELINVSITANTAPAHVPATAIAIVSSIRYITPLFPVINMYSQSGCVIPCIIAPTTLIPSFDVDTSLTALRLYTKNTMIHTLIITFAVVFLLIRPSRYAFRNVLIPSTTSTATKSITRIIPTLLYSRQLIFSLSSSPIPPAPT